MKNFDSVPKSLHTVCSPALVLDLRLVESNLHKMIEIAGSADRLRPHCKTHKMSAVTKWQMDLGISKHKCATFAEARMLAECGVGDIFLAYNVVGPNVERTLDLVSDFPDLKFSVTGDDADAIIRLNEKGAARFGDQVENFAIEMLLDFETGMGRTGRSIEAGAEKIYETICDTKLKFIQPGGIHIYDGHLKQKDFALRNQKVIELWEQVKTFRQVLMDRGFSVPRCVAGGTGSFPCWAQIDDPLLELSPGTPVFYDAGYREAFPDLDFVPAAAILTRVISKPKPGCVTLDLGHKACAADPPQDRRLVFPELTDAKLTLQSEEHLVVQTEHAKQIEVGQEFFAIPWHICPTSALHQYAHTIGKEGVLEKWRVDARHR